LIQLQFFPWRLFWKFFLTLAGLLNGLFVASLAVASYIFDFSFYTPKPFYFTLCFFAFSIGSSAWFSYRFVLPLRRVIVKALRLASKKYVSEFEEDDVLLEGPEEYQELEHALDKIRKKLKKRRLQLSHEREEIQTLMSSMEDAIVSAGVDQKLVFFNSQFAAQFLSSSLLQSREEGRAIALIDCMREPVVLELFDQVLKTGESSSKQIRLRTQLDGPSHPSGTVALRYYSLRVSPLREENTRELYGVLAVFHDITEMKKAEQIRIEFVENASHELRTPLTSVKGFVETLREDVNAGRLEQAPQFLNIISKNVDRLTELVNDMMTISTLEGASPLRLETINPALITEDVIARLSSLATEKQILMKSHFSAGNFRADAHKVEQVLFNLIGNAIKYIPEKSMVEIVWSETSAREVRLSIKDNGPGIAEEHLSRLFERFYRVDRGRSRDVGGTGLGLSIVKHIMQSHGGSVSVKSELGVGAEFICLFPMVNQR
jgi:two-component system, OmpR family, phosphate regulon sensor histidine kinase PhoR